ncbi:MAG: nicotinamide-nucleotide amidohydrolase family protein [Leptospiraceae bacterium]|nr:nicotinamide-nucleotide amidohydrolase family protein [Leptospiraceae bacterium]
MRPAIYILSTGTELSSGRSIDTNAPTIARALAEHGFTIAGLGTLPDDREILLREIQHVLERPEVGGLIMTGGLGPTDDDHTVEVLSELTGKPIIPEPNALRKLEIFARRFKRRFSQDSARRQVRALEGALVLENKTGLAPGILVDVALTDASGQSRSPFVAAMPGVPQEMLRMLDDVLLPELEKRYPDVGHARRTFHLYGVGESVFQGAFFGAARGQSAVSENEAAPITQDFDFSANFQWGITAGDGQLKVFFESEDESELDRLVAMVRNAYPLNYLERSAIDILHTEAQDNKWQIGAAESCTGGLIGKLLTDRPGSSAFFRGSLVTYSNTAKQRLLGVTEDTLQNQGAVSRECAQAMARGALSALECDYSVAVTGIAGPGGGTESKPVGTVFLACAHQGGEGEVHQLNLPLDRDRVRLYTAHLAVFHLLKFIHKVEGR